jgi:small subunit ribosomal protein S2
MIKKIKAKRNYKLITWNYKEVIKNEIYIGENKRRWNPALMGYVFKVVNKIHLIDIRSFLTVIKKGFELISEIIKNRGKFVLAGNSKTNGRKILKLILKSKQPYIKTIYYAGGITRKKENIRQYLEVKKGVTNITVRKKFIDQLLGLKRMRKKPAIMVILDAYQGKYLINECRKLGITTMGAGSTNLNLPNLTYKLIGNFIGRKQRILLLILIYHAIFEGIRKETSVFASYHNEIKTLKNQIIVKKNKINKVREFKKVIRKYIRKAKIEIRKQARKKRAEEITIIKKKRK